MKQITEDYVSYETAVLLKEKGFDVPTENFYDNTCENLKDMKTIYGGIPDFGEVNWNADPFVCEGFSKLITFSKPTQSLALKWLREVHKFIVLVEYDTFADEFYCYIRKKSKDYIIPTDSYNSYEKAVETALKYTLENLI